MTVQYRSPLNDASAIKGHHALFRNQFNRLQGTRASIAADQLRDASAVGGAQEQ